VGSGCYDPKVYAASIQSASTVFNQAADVGFNFKLLDIGGGFPGEKSDEESFEKVETFNCMWSDIFSLSHVNCFLYFIQYEHKNSFLMH